MSIAQNATLSGKVTDDKGKAIEAASISTSSNTEGVISNRDGSYSIEIPMGQDIILNVTHISFKAQQWKVNLKEGETRVFNVNMKTSSYKINEVEVKAEKDRDKPMESVDPKNIKYIPSPNGSFEAIIKTLPGVSSNNELTSQYNVRGGSFDENLVYITKH